MHPEQTQASGGHAAQTHEPAKTELREPWLDDLGELPPRPRRRWLAPAPLALLGVLLIACGFIGGVLVEKGQSGGASASPGGALASRLRALAGATGTRAASTGAASGASTGGAATGGGAAGGTSPFAAAGAGRATTGTVSFSSDGTLYVTDGESNTVKVKTSAATSVTKTAKSSVSAIRPGETVTIAGSTAPNGTVSAESIRVGAGSGLASLFAGAAASGGASSTGKGSTSSGPALFGNG